MNSLHSKNNFLNFNIFIYFLLSPLDEYFQKNTFKDIPRIFLDSLVYGDYLGVNIANIELGLNILINKLFYCISIFDRINQI